MKSLFAVFKENKVIFFFFFKIIAFYLAWFVFYELIMGPSGPFDRWLTDTVAGYSKFFLQLMGYKVQIGENLKGNVVVWLNNRRLLGISSACNGQVLYPLFTAFIVATSGHWLRKLLMIVVGCLLIFQVNAIRVISLVLLKYYKPEWLDFNHRYTFVLLVFGFIFFLWVLWVNKISNVRQINKDAEKKAVV
ncbi:MAG: archaeosortase/exosortase family protein [Cytophagales bacterium]